MASVVSSPICPAGVVGLGGKVDGGFLMTSMIAAAIVIWILFFLILSFFSLILIFILTNFSLFSFLTVLILTLT